MGGNSAAASASNIIITIKITTEMSDVILSVVQILQNDMEQIR